MPDKLSQNPALSQRWLTIMIVAMTMLAGVHASMLSYIIIFMGFLLPFIWRDEEGYFPQPDRVAALLFAALLAYAAASLQWTLDPARAFYDLLITGILTFIALQLPARIRTIKAPEADYYLRWFVFAFVTAMLLFAMDICFHLVWQRALRNMSWKSRLYLALTTRACLCGMLLLWPVLHYFWQRRWRITAIFTWCTTGVLAFLSDTAAGRLAFAVSTLVFIVARFSPRAVRVIFAAVLIAGMTIAVPIAQIAEDTLEHAVHHVNGSFGQRTEIWKFTAKRILEKPAFGWGFDSSRAMPNFGEVSKYQHYDPTRSIIPMHPHNWFLHVLLELGIVGAVIVTALWLWLLYQTAHLHRGVQPVALAIFSTTMVVGAFSIGIWQSWWLAVLILAAMILQLCSRRMEKAP